MYVLIFLILFVLQHNGITLDTTICTGELNFLKDCPNVVVLLRLQHFSNLNVLYFNVEYIFIARLRCICSFVAWTIFLANLACIKLRVQCKTYSFYSLINLFSHII